MKSLLLRGLRRTATLCIAVSLGACSHAPYRQPEPTASSGIRSTVTADSNQPVPYIHRHGALTEKEMQMAKTAWRYFENNYQPETGLVNAVDGYPSTTMWDTASYLGALVSAQKLGLIDERTMSDRMGKMMRTLNNLNFFKGELPNKVYHTKTAEKVNYGNQPGEIGFSGIDLGRMLVWLRIIKENYPEQANSIDNFVLRWNFTNAIDKCGTIYGAMMAPDGKVQYVQEGRLGYEEYSAKGFQLWGFSSCLSSRPEPYETEPMYCVDVPFDTRDPRQFSQHNYVVSESYVLDGIELGWDKTSDRDSSDDVHTDKMMENFAHRIYQVQENRHKATGILTARSEHQLDQAPYFVYDTIYSDGFPWNTITDTGKYVPEFSAISLKAALGLWALWESPYTDLLASAIWQQYVPEKGYYEGILENGKGPIKAFTANNNGIMLESLLFKQEGKLLKFNKAEPLYKNLPPSLWDRHLTNAFEAENKGRGRPSVIPDGGALGSSDKKSWNNKSCPLDSTGEPGKCPVCPACSVCQDDTPVTLPAWSSCH